MPRLLLALYLLTSLMGRGAFVLCVEGESAPALELVLQACCEDNDDSGRAEASTAPGSVVLTEDSCPCVDLPADFLLLHRLDLGATGMDLPALLPCTVPATVLAMPEASRTENQFSFEADRGRPDLPGAGAAPRVLRT